MELPLLRQPPEAHAPPPFKRACPVPCLLGAFLAGLGALQWLAGVMLPRLTSGQSHALALLESGVLAVLTLGRGLRAAEQRAWQAQTDLHAQRGLEQALRDSEQQYRMAFENATHGMYRTTPDGQILLGNPALLEMLGYESFAALATRNLEATGTEADYERQDFKTRLEAAGTLRGLEYVWKRQDGQAIFVRENAQVVRGEDGESLWYEGSVEDVTARKEAEERLRQSEARFQRNAANVPGMMYQFLRRADGRMTFPYVSDGCRDIYGLEPSAIVQDAQLAVGPIHPDDLPGFYDSVSRSAQTLRPWKWQGRIVLPGSVVKWIEGAARPEHQPGGDILWDGLLMDITDRKAIEDALRRSHEELEAHVRARTADLADANAALHQENQERRRAERQIVALNGELVQAYDATIEGWSRALDLRDKETEGHCRRVTDLSVRLALTLGLQPDSLVALRRGALLHDIGKMGVPDAILLKPGPLTDEEWTVMRSHPVLAYKMLSPITFLRPALDIPHCHHEKWDGTGYPQGLAGEQIPLAARIFAVVDVWDAMCSDRPYRAGWPPERVCAHIHSLSGSHFDPQVVEAFLSLMSDCAPERPDALLRAA